MEVLHEDYLERCINTSNKKEYKKQYFVFRQDSAGGKTLEYFKDTNWRKSEPRGVCNLFNGYAVSVLGPNETKKRYGIELKTVGKTFELHASSEQSRDTWIDVLNRDIENFHSAKLLESPPTAYSVVKLLAGHLHLQITDCSVVLLANRVPSITWRFGTIRRYKSKDGAFVLEVGRKAPTGEGIFRFQVQDPNKLFDELDRALKQRIALKRTQDSSFDAINRSSSFDGQLPDRRSMNLRSPSIEDRTLPLPSPPGYSSLDQVPIPRPSPGLPPEVNGYDRLFGDTIPPHSIPPTPPPLTVFNNRSIIGRRTIPDVEPPDENYIDMSGVKEELIRESKNAQNKGPEIKPRPVPRPGKPPYISSPIPININTLGNISSDTNNGVVSPGANNEVVSTSATNGVVSPTASNGVVSPSATDVDLIDLNTYESPSTIVESIDPLSKGSMVESEDSEYHALNSHTPPKSVCPAPGYDHLSNMNVNKIATSLPNSTQNVSNSTQSVSNTTQSMSSSTSSLSSSTTSVLNSTRPVSSTSCDLNENIYGNAIVQEMYDSPKVQTNKKQSNPVPPAKPGGEHVRKPPPPVPSRPQIPVRRPRRGSDRINSCESLPDTVLVLGKTSSQPNTAPNSSETLLYDSPRGINELANTKKAQSLNSDVFLYMNRNESLSEYQIPRTEEP